jgi:hypothetical protein
MHLYREVFRCVDELDKQRKHRLTPALVDTPLPQQRQWRASHQFRKRHSIERPTVDARVGCGLDSLADGTIR